MNPIIRPATEKDVPSMMDMVNELALFEKAPLEVINTAEQMTIDGFGLNPLYKSFVAEGDTAIIGFALYYYRYSTWKGKVLYLEDFYVKEKYRNFGVGKLLFDQIIATAKADDCKRISWQVLEWNQSAISFYKKYKTQFDTEWWNGFINLE